MCVVDINGENKWCDEEQNSHSHPSLSNGHTLSVWRRRFFYETVVAFGLTRANRWYGWNKWLVIVEKARSSYPSTGSIRSRSHTHAHPSMYVWSSMAWARCSILAVVLVILALCVYRYCMKGWTARLSMWGRPNELFSTDYHTHTHTGIYADMAPHDIAPIIPFQT